MEMSGLVTMESRPQDAENVVEQQDGLAQVQERWESAWGQAQHNLERCHVQQQELRRAMLRSESTRILAPVPLEARVLERSELTPCLGQRGRMTVGDVGPLCPGH